MKWLVIFACVVAALAEELSLAEECDVEKCKLPDCRCSGTDIPGGFKPYEIPQVLTIRVLKDYLVQVNVSTMSIPNYIEINSVAY